LKSGAFTFVLHSHLPYVRRAGLWPHGEEMLHEVMAETYVPLLDALYELIDEGLSPRLTIGLTPILMEQLSDDDVKDHFEAYLQDRMTLAQADADFYQAEGDPQRLTLALFYLTRYWNTLESFRSDYQRDLVGAFRRLQAGGYLDVLTSAATHGYLPLLERDSSLYGQLATGVGTYRRLMGCAPRGAWLPECAYRPAYIKETEQGKLRKPGLEEFLSGLGLGYFFTETHVIRGGAVVGKAAGDVVGPYGRIPVRQVVPLTEGLPQAEAGTTFRPYGVRATDVAVFARDEGTGLQVWSATTGYPGDFAYREFHRKDSRSGLQYWRVTGPGVELKDKDWYDPATASARVQQHAGHFVELVKQRLADFQASSGQYGIVVSAYDTELFGHWWFEGVNWLKEVLRRLAVSEEVELTTARDYLQAHPPQESLALPESSWGQGGTHWTWLNPETEWMWKLIHHAERQMERLVDKYPTAEGELLDLLNQTARELLLLESSDWPFLMTTGQAAEYAANRFQEHLSRFNHLAMLAEAGRVDAGTMAFVREIEDMDNPFPQLDYRLFEEREGRAGGQIISLEKRK